MDKSAPAKTLEMTARLLSEAGAATAVRIQLLVVNGSSKVVKAGGKWAVKDEGTQTVAEATFPRILPGQEAERYVTLPGGVEWGIFKFEEEGSGGTWAAPHGGNNTLSYKLTLQD